MTRPISIHLLPALFEPEELRGGTAVVFDVLRASTTILHALAHGAETVIACGSVEDARHAASLRDREQTLLAGERGGLLIDGFDLDNSPQRFTPEVVSGKTIIFTTTNGTAALLRSREAAAVFVGGFVNLSAVVQQLQSRSGPIHLVCAGTAGKISAEDACCAGAVAARLLEEEDEEKEFRLANDEAELAVGFSDGFGSSEYIDALILSRGGQNCARLNFQQDMQIAASVDLFDFVPTFDPNTREIRRVD